MAAGLLQHRLLSIIVPLAAQIHSERGKWRKLGRPPILGSASPYADDRGILAHAGAALAKPGAECLLLDCIGFTERHRSRLAAIGLPVILSNALMAKAVGELFSGWGGKLTTRGGADAAT
jgi:protein AroM